MPDIAITNGGLIPKKNLRLSNFVGTLSSTDTEMIEEVADKQIVVWGFGAWSNNDSRSVRILVTLVAIIGIAFGDGTTGYIDLGDAPIVLATNTPLSMDIEGASTAGGYWVIYSLIDPIIRT